MRQFKFVVLGLLIPGALAAQQSATVSRELAEAFVRGYTPADSLEKVSFVEGQVPADLQAAAHLPEGVRLLGTVVLSRSSYVLSMSGLSPDSALKAIAREYGRAGWRALAQVRSASTTNPAMGGFRQPPPTVLTQFCNDSSDVNVSAARVPGGETEIRLRIGKAQRCPGLNAGMRVAQPTAQLPLPRLLDPPATTPTIDCYVRAGSQSTTTQLGTTLPPAALIEHYGRQMESQGWTLAAPDEPVARRVWTRRDAAGVTEVATLQISVTPNAPACRDASLQVMTLRNP